MPERGNDGWIAEANRTGAIIPTAPKTFRPPGLAPAQREKTWASRQSSAGRQWYQHKDWKGPGGLREQRIIRDLCQCQQCKREGRTTWVLIHAKRGGDRIAHVDHKEPHNGDWDKFWDIEGCETLCSSCHSRKTTTEDGGFGNQ